jgi:hypothetical protein
MVFYNKTIILNQYLSIFHFLQNSAILTNNQTSFTKDKTNVMILIHNHPT